MAGLTSGNRFPSQQTHAPWKTMVQYCDVLFPQTYWRTDDNGEVIEIHHGTPHGSIDLAMTAWSRIEAGRRIIPIGGPLKLSSVDDLVAFADVAKGHGWDEVHYYVDEHAVEDVKYEALAKL